MELMPHSLRHSRRAQYRGGGGGGHFAAVHLFNPRPVVFTDRLDAVTPSASLSSLKHSRGCQLRVVAAASQQPFLSAD